MNRVIGSAPAPASPGAVLHTFQLADDRALRLWRETLACTSRCLLITGRALGLDHPSLERIDILLKEGEALAAVATATVGHDPRRAEIMAEGVLSAGEAAYVHRPGGPPSR